MYRFVDITKQQSVVDLPSEAMQVNGVYLENEISGYRTLYTEGRETLETEISTIDNDYIDGAIEDSARDLSRAVRVHFLLVSHSPAEFREKFHRLNRLLRTRDSVFIFRDEPDKYLKGTKTDITDVEPGRLATEGCINIVCNDPYKYAIDEKVVAAHLATRDMPDPDLLIRTAGDLRLSNYLLWQIAYSELYFTPTYWPDFTQDDFLRAIVDYQGRERRYGMTSEQVESKNIDHNEQNI